MNGKLIIISDKDAEFSKELSEMLNDNNYNTLSFTKPEKALKSANKLQPYIMLFDVHVNGELAIKYADKLLHLSRKNKIYIVAMATFCDNDNNNCIAIKEKTGIRDCMIKPIKPVEILKKIKNIIDDSDDSKSNNKNDQHSRTTF